MAWQKSLKWKDRVGKAFERQNRQKGDGQAQSTPMTPQLALPKAYCELLHGSRLFGPSKGKRSRVEGRRNDFANAADSSRSPALEAQPPVPLDL